ncbi:MAG: hypothetical protein ACI840_002750 [Ulvibacter sp.]|jgi:hypothetical protein
MESKKKFINFGILTYVLAFLLFNLWNYINSIIIPQNKDWEIFSYTFFASIMLYGIALVLFIILSLFIKSKKMNRLLTLILVYVLIEVVAILILKESIIISIFKTIFLENGGNYVSFLFPISLIISYFISYKIIKTSGNV